MKEGARGIVWGSREFSRVYMGVIYFLSSGEYFPAAGNQTQKKNVT